MLIFKTPLVKTFYLIQLLVTLIASVALNAQSLSFSKSKILPLLIPSSQVSVEYLKNAFCGLPENMIKDFYQYYNKINIDKDVVLFKLITCQTFDEGRSLSMIYVTEKNIYYISTDSYSNKRFIEKSLSKNEKDSILDILRKIDDLKPSKLNNFENKRSCVILEIFSKNKEKSFYVFAPNNFIDLDCNKENKYFMILRAKTLDLLGLDYVWGYNLSNSYLLKKKLRSDSLLTYKDLKTSIAFFLMKNRPDLPRFYEDLWRYYANGDNEIDKYILMWLFAINNVLKSGAELNFDYLLKDEYANLINEINPEENLLFNYIYYNLSIKNNDKKLEKQCLDFFENYTVKISDKLLHLSNKTKSNTSIYYFLISNKFGIEIPFVLSNEKVYSQDFHNSKHIAISVSNDEKLAFEKLNLKKSGYNKADNVFEIRLNDVVINSSNFDCFKNDDKSILISKNENKIIFIDFNWNNY